VYTVAGIGLARQGSFVLHDEAADRIGAEGMHRLYGEAEPGWLRAAACVKYPGFYYVDIARGSIVAQGLPLLPALIAIFYATSAWRARWRPPTPSGC